MRIDRKRIINESILPYVGIFSAFLLVAATAVFFWSPVIGSHADSGRTAIGAKVNPVIALSFNKEEVILNITPTAYGAQAEDSITATVDTNSSSGYQLYLSAIDNNGDMTSETTDAVISAIEYFSFYNDKPLDSIGNNMWGYSMSGSGEHYMGIPLFKYPKQIAWVQELPDGAEKSTTVYFGANVNMQLPSGRYSKTVEFTAIANQVEDPTAFDGISDMQEMTHSICANAAIGASTILVDTRDGKQYPVEKLEDGKCWMKNDLRIVGPLTLTAENSNVQTDFELPAPLGEDESLISYKEYDSPLLQRPFGYASNEIDGTGYNYCAASAGTICEEAKEDEATSSICPKGWTLPSVIEYDNLLDTYDFTQESNTREQYSIIMHDPFNYSLSWHGYMDDDNNNYATDWWTSSYHEENYRQTFSTSAFDNPDRYYIATVFEDAAGGAAIRCIAE